MTTFFVQPNPGKIEDITDTEIKEQVVEAVKKYQQKDTPKSLKSKDLYQLIEPEPIELEFTSYRKF